MTVFEAYSKLWDFFQENDSFVMEEDFRKVELITISPARDKAAVQSALDSWTKDGFLTKQVQEAWSKELKTNETKVIYVLKKPIATNDQSVSVNSNMAGYITKEINNFCELIEDKTDWSDPTDITQKDVLNILHILNFYKEKYREEIGLDPSSDHGEKNS